MVCSGTRQINPVTSGEGVPPAMEVAAKRIRRLFNKNTGLCKVVKTMYRGSRLPGAGRLKGGVSRKAKL